MAKEGKTVSINPAPNVMQVIFRASLHLIFLYNHTYLSCFYSRNKKYYKASINNKVMKTCKHLFVLLFLGSFLISACSTEEDMPDLRGQLAGEYLYTKTVYTNFGIESESGALNISSDNADESRLIISEEATFYGSTLDAYDSTFLFYIPQQDLEYEKGKTLTISGVSNVAVQDRRSDAGYFPSQNRLQLYYKVVYSDDPVQNYSVSILAEKKQ